MDLPSSIASFVLLFNLFHANEETLVKEKTTYHPTYAHQVMDILKEQVEKEYKFHCCGRGGSMPTDIRSLSVDFETKKIPTIPEAREIIIKIVEKFQNIVNSHENIRPFLREYPFPIERIGISIRFNLPPIKEEKQLKIHPKYVCCITGIVDYCQDDETGWQYIDIHSEPYEEALRIVRAQN